VLAATSDPNFVQDVNESAGSESRESGGEASRESEGRTGKRVKAEERGQGGTCLSACG
jgi:hypothetical protein